MKTHSWPHPVLVSSSISEAQYERDYQDGIDFTFSLKKSAKDKFEAKIMVGSTALRRHIGEGEVDLVLYFEALESPLRQIRRLDASTLALGSTLEVPVDLDQSKFSGGLKVCVYLVAQSTFELSTVDCVEGYAPKMLVESGALLGYSNAHLLYDDKSNISNLFKVRKDERLELMTVSSEDDLIVVSLPKDMFEKYTLFRLKNTNVTSCSFLFPALVETIALMVAGHTELEQWPDGFYGARFVVAQSLAKEGLAPRDVAQKGAVYAASALFSKFKENHAKLFNELSTSYKSE
jgi:hypothetical protein